MAVLVVLEALVIPVAPTHLSTNENSWKISKLVLKKIITEKNVDENLIGDKSNEKNISSRNDIWTNRLQRSSRTTNLQIRKTRTDQCCKTCPNTQHNSQYRHCPKLGLNP
jgi:hypothetical protein